MNSLTRIKKILYCFIVLLILLLTYHIVNHIIRHAAPTFNNLTLQVPHLNPNSKFNENDFFLIRNFLCLSFDKKKCYVRFYNFNYLCIRIYRINILVDFNLWGEVLQLCLAYHLQIVSITYQVSVKLLNSHRL